MAYQSHRVAAIVPAHNESEAIYPVVSGLAALAGPLSGDGTLFDAIIVCDNASTDNTLHMAKQAGATTIFEPKPGYGAACLAAMKVLAEPGQPAVDVVVFVDGDQSVDADEVPVLIQALLNGTDLVIGKRVQQLEESGAMKVHQKLGTKLASKLISLLWQQPVTDLGPLRAIRYQDLLSLNMQDQRFGWTTEMQIKALQAKLRYTEIPVSTRKRLGKSKISGTIKGTVTAARDIFGTIFKLYWQNRFHNPVMLQNKPEKI